MRIGPLTISFGRKQTLSSIKRQTPLSIVKKGTPQRSYDAASTNRFNQNHWQYADARDADGIINADLPILRNRARYEIRNNGYAEGIVDTLGNDMVGTGPRLQVQSGDSDLDRRIEKAFKAWCKVCDMSETKSFADIIKLTGSRQQTESGESLVILQSSSQGTPSNWFEVKKEQVRLRMMVIEPDRLQTPPGLFGTGGFDTEKVRNGVEVDEFGRPQFYYILKKHPGSTYNFGNIGEYDKVPASHVIHLYVSKRPEQTRGIPWITSSISLFAQLRRFTLATLETAEQAANISAALENEFASTEEDEVEAMDEIEIPRGSILTLPNGSKMFQFKPEHPAATYKEFKGEILNEIARCINMPFNVAAGNSSNYNYASGRLDKQMYFKFIKTVRGWIASRQLDRIFYAWLREAVLLGMFPQKVLLLEPEWYWPGNEHVDPMKEAKAQDIRLKNNSTTYATEYANQGKDWEREFEQRAKEKAKMEELGLTVEDVAPDKTEKDDEDEDKKPEK